MILYDFKTDARDVALQRLYAKISLINNAKSDLYARA
jgi:hypothetical protein